MSEIKKYRESVVCGNMEYHVTDDKYNEIVRWFENEYYDCPKNNKKLVEKGYKRNEDGSWENNNQNGCKIYIDSSCTKGKRSCCVVATIRWSRDESEFDVVCCGTRPFELPEKDYADFLQILEVLKQKERNLD